MTQHIIDTSTHNSITLLRYTCGEPSGMLNKINNI